ncbi:hypothetical protein [Bradyrhizobium sp. LHD-71]|uniref:hypothetical protein n=1 Tax=Bradyrhizobium sp. LHD-71 TaxID=3072141 RepID=UPI00280D1E42|nr:hypothetical protein [Bradyrhizobium sp. LHD-71]MDQ8727329.1 hypothetical protein [Bradyrhizobium sp. LHD-71]
MSIKTKLATLAVAALAVTGGIAASTQTAYAGPKGKAIAAGLVGAAIVGTTFAAMSQPHYYHPVRHCAWKPQFNVFGQFVGHARVCHYH